MDRGGDRDRFDGPVNQVQHRFHGFLFVVEPGESRATTDNLERGDDSRVKYTIVGRRCSGQRPCETPRTRFRRVKLNGSSRRISRRHIFGPSPFQEFPGLFEDRVDLVGFGYGQTHVAPKAVGAAASALSLWTSAMTVSSERTRATNSDLKPVEYVSWANWRCLRNAESRP